MMRIFAILFILAGSLSTHSQELPVSNWAYIGIDSTHVKYGDYDEPAWLRYFGLDMGDMNGDGYAEVVAGREIYINPGARMEGIWKKVMLPENADGIFSFDVDGDDRADVIAQALPNIWWFEATSEALTRWQGKIVGQVPATGHVNSQGFEKGQIIAGGNEEFVIAGAGGIYLFEVHEQGFSNTLIAENTADEGIGLGDLDGDGDLDLAAGRVRPGETEPSILVWFENPGHADASWKDHLIGQSNHAIDRMEIADVDGDGKADVVMAEERYPGKEPDGNLFWYRQGKNLEENSWERRHITTQWSSNNLDVDDIDRDGDVDIVTAEHKGPELSVELWLNNGQGVFTEKVIDQGKESHLGTQWFDMDSDGDLDLVSIGWDQYRNVHLWRNDAITDMAWEWKRFSSETGDMEPPNDGNQQTASLVADLDNDGINDFVITERTQAPSVVWYKKNGYRWDRKVVDAAPLRIEAGSAHYDIDGDGDEDIVFGGESASNQVWWWENPYPDFSQPWNRYTIKDSGAKKHHDQIFGDFDGDGQQELVFWNQGDNALYLAEIPRKPKQAKEWPMQLIYSWSNDSEMQPLIGMNAYPGWAMVNEHEGLAKADIDGDGIDDIVGGGRWFKYNGGSFIENIIDASYTFSRSAVGQFIAGGRPEVVLVVGDGKGPMYLYQWHEWEGWQGMERGTGTWERTMILPELDNGHTLETVDFNGDGYDDLFSAEMRFGSGNPDAHVRILLGNGKGEFLEKYVVTGYGVHEGKIADLDGDGDYDVLGKPYTWKAPLINIWLNQEK